MNGTNRQLLNTSRSERKRKIYFDKDLIEKNKNEYNNCVVIVVLVVVYDLTRVQR